MPAPSTPAPTVPASNGHIIVGAQYTLPGGQAIYIRDPDPAVSGYIRLDGTDATNPPSVTISGVYTAESTTTSGPVGFAVFGPQPSDPGEYNLITNTASGQIYVHGTGAMGADPAASSAYGADLHRDTTFVNSGLVQAVSDHASAFGIVSADSSRVVFNNAASGVLKVYGLQAIGVVRAAVDNAGLIEAVGDGYYTVAVRDPTSLNNSGVIRASGSGSYSVGVEIAEGTTNHRYVNSGTIEADRAFHQVPRSGYPNYADVTIINSGKLIGDISLSEARHEVRNTGEINGNVGFGDAPSIYNGVGGNLTGGLYLRDAGNTAFLGDDGETVYLQGGWDTVTGGAGDDQFFMDRGAHVIDGGGGVDSLSMSAFAAAVDLQAGTVATSGTSSTIAHIENITGGGWNDTLTGEGGANAIDGGWGDDIIQGLGGADTLNGGAGADLLTGGTGADRFVIAAGQSGVTAGALDVIGDWSSEDALAFTGLAASATYEEATAADYASALTLANGRIAGGVDVVAVQVGADVVVFADNANDNGQADDAVVLTGRGLGDIAAANLGLTEPAPPPPAPPPSGYGGGGGGGSGPSTAGENLTAGPGATEIHAGPGDDTITGGAEPTYLRGDEGDDRIVGGSAFDNINGNMGNDTCSGQDGDDWVVGGKNDDWLSGDAGDDIVYGNMGDDFCQGGEGNDILRGGQDQDVLIGGAGADWLSGDRGSDTLTGGAGADVFHTFGDAGLDRVLDFSRAEGDRVMVDPGTTYSIAQAGEDTVITLGGGGQMVLVDVQAASLTGDWIFGA